MAEESFAAKIGDSGVTVAAGVAAGGAAGAAAGTTDGMVAGIGNDGSCAIAMAIDAKLNKRGLKRTEFTILNTP
jgi:hypothetical protein